MTRRSLFSSRHSLSSRVLNMMASLFRRRWAAPVVRRPHARASSRLREWADAASAAAARVVDSHLLTLRDSAAALTAPEYLEGRQMMAVSTNVTSTTGPLAIWMDASNDHTYLRTVGSGATARLQVSNNAFFAGGLVYNGAVPSQVLAYDGGNYSLTLASGGTGYTTAPTITAQNYSFSGQSFNTSISTGLNLTGVIVTNAGANLAGSFQSILISGAGSTTSAILDLTISGGSVTSAAIRGVTAGVSNGTGGGGANFSATTGLTVAAVTPIASTTATQPTFTFTGSVGTVFNPVNGLGTVTIANPTSGPALGYYRAPHMSWNGSPGGANMSLTVTTSATWANTGLTADEQSTQLPFDLQIGQYYAAGGTPNEFGAQRPVTGPVNPNTTAQFGNDRLSGIENVQIAAGSTATIWVTDADNIALEGAYSAGAADALNLSLARGFAAGGGGPGYDDIGTTAATGNITVGAAGTFGSVNIDAGYRTLNISGALSSAANTSLEGNDISIGSAFSGSTSFYAKALNNLTLNGAVSTKSAASTEWVLLQAGGGTLSLNQNVTVSGGTATLSADTLTGGGRVTARDLSLREGGGAVNYTLNADVSNLAGNTASNLTFSNLRDLNIGLGALVVEAINKVDAITVTGNGTGLTDGTYLRQLTGGGGSGAFVTFVVSGGTVTQAILSSKGQGYTNAAGITFAALPGGGTQPTLTYTLASNAANSLIVTGSGDVNVSANITMQSGGNLAITAGQGVIITGTILPNGNPLDLTIVSGGNINATSALNLGAGDAVLSAAGDISLQSLTGDRLNVTTTNGNISVTETDSLIVDNATVTGTGNVSITTLSGLLTLDGVLRIGTAGTATLQSNRNDISINGAALVPAATGSLVLNAINGSVLSGTNGSRQIATGNLTWIAQSGTSEFLTDDTKSNFATLAANITGASQGLTVLAGRSLTLSDITTKSGPVDVTVANATSSPNITVTGNILAGNTLAAANRQNVSLTATNGFVASTGSITGNVLSISAQKSSSLSSQNVLQLNATISGAGESLTVTSTRDLRAGDITLAGGLLSVTHTGGNLTRAGTIDTGTGGSALLSVPAGSILGTGQIISDSLNFSAITVPDLTPTNATFTKLAANVTQSGNINLVRATNLTIERAITAFGDIAIDLANGPLGTSLTINGPLTAGGGGNITLNAATGAITTTANAGNFISANVLTVVSKSDISLNTNVATLSANVSDSASGNITVTEQSGLIVGAGNITAANNIVLNVLAGDLVRTGAIRAVSGSTVTGNVTLNVAAGGVTGSGAISANVLDWTTKSSAAINDAALTFSSISASVTGAGNSLAIAKPGDFTVLSAGTASGDISITSNTAVGVPTGNIALNGPVTAGGGKNVLLSAVAGNVSAPNAAAVVTGGTLTLGAQNTTVLSTNVATLAASVSAGDLSITDASGLDIAAGADVTTFGNVSIAVGNAAVGSLTGAGNIVSGNQIALSASNGGVTLTGVARGIDLAINSKNASSANTNVTNLTATISAGGLTIVEADSVTIAPNDITAAGPVSITSTAGSIVGSAAGVINAGTTGNVTLAAPNGAVTFTASSNQVTGNVLTITARDASSLVTNVAVLVANVTAGGLTINEATDLAIGNTAGTTVTTTGFIALNLGAGNLSGLGSINAGMANVTINAALGSVTLNSSANQITGNVLTIDTANGPVNVTTKVNLVVANVTGLNQNLTINQTGNLTVDGPSLKTNGGDIAVISTGNITRTGEINAASGNVTLSAAGGNIVGAGLITGNVLTVTASNSSSLNTAVNAVAGSLSGNLASLTVVELDDLDIAGTNLTTNNGTVSIVLGNASTSGNLGGSGVINALTGDVTLNAVNGSVTLSGVGQVRGRVLTVNATDDSTVGTTVSELAANIANSAASFTVRETNGLAINLAGVTTNAGLIDIATTTGSINGTGTIDATTGDLVLTASGGSVNLTAGSNQVRGTNLTLTASTTSAVNTLIDDIQATVAGGGLTVAEGDGLTVNLGSVVAGGAIAISAAGDIVGTGSIVAAAGLSPVTLNATNGGGVDFSSGSIRGSVLTVNAEDVSTVSTNVTTLVANIQNGGFTVFEDSGLAIGTSSTSNVVAQGLISITLQDGSLTGSGTINANGAANDVTLFIASGSGGITLNSVASQVRADQLSVTLLSSGVVNLNSAANTLSALTTNGDFRVNQTQSLTIAGMVVGQGDVNVTLSAGDLAIDSGSILGGQLSNVTLNVVAGAINSVDLSGTGDNGIIFANTLDLVANSSSFINTSITTLTAQLTGDNQDLAVVDIDDISSSGTADGLSIGAAGIRTLGGNVTLNVGTVDNSTFTPVFNTGIANLLGNAATAGNISTVNSSSATVEGIVTLFAGNGAALLTARSGQVSAETLRLVVSDSSTINSNVTQLDSVPDGLGGFLPAISTFGVNQTLTINELNDLFIGANGVSTINGSDLVLNVAGILGTAGGPLSADGGLANVTLNVPNGFIDLTGTTITANLLTIRSQNDVNVFTNVASLAANVTVGSLTVTEDDDLTIAAGNVVARGVSIQAGNVADGRIDGDGVINGVTGNVTLVADNIALPGTGANSTLPQVVGNVLTVNVANGSDLRTNVTALAAAVTGFGESLAITEASNLAINAADGGVTTNGGQFTLVVNGTLSGDGDIDATTGGDVLLNANAGINLTGTITADLLDVRTNATLQTANASVRTNVAELAANVGGILTVAELNDLVINSAGVRGARGVSITAGNSSTAGTISGTGAVSSAANVSLNAPNGAITLNAVAGQVSGNVLTLSALNATAANTNVTSVTASIGGSAESLTIVDVDTLNIAAGGVVTNSGPISITTGANSSGNLGGTGSISAGTNDVTLVVNGATTVTGTITANVLDLTAVNSSTINTSINELLANITNPNQFLNVTESSGLNIAGGNVQTNDGDISLRVSAGDLTITGGLSAGAANVTLAVPAGRVDASGTISGNVLAVSASNSSLLSTAVNTVTANITGSGNTLTIIDADSVAIGSGGLKTNNGAIAVTAGNQALGTLTISNPINAATANVNLTNANGGINGSPAGLVTGNVLNVQVLNSSTLTTNVTTLVGTISGVDQILTVTDTANGLNIGAANLNASGPGSGLVLNVQNGSLSGAGSILAASGDIVLNVPQGNLNTTGSINAGTGNLTFTVANGSVNLPSSNQVAGNVLTVSASGVSNLSTALNGISANITGANSTLVVTDTDGLTVTGGGILTNGGNVTLTAGKDAAGDLTINGPITAANRTVSLYSANGGIDGAGVVTTNNLTVVSVNTATLATNVSNIAALITGAGAGINVSELNGLNVANVVATNGATLAGIVATNGATAITVAVATGNLTGSGAINAGPSGSVALNAAAGGITLNGAQQITGSVLDLTAQTASIVNTNVASLTALITGAGQSLTVTELNELAANGISTNNGDLVLKLSNGNLSGTGGINAGTANATLTATGGRVILNAAFGQVSANTLSVVALNDSVLNTNVASLTANVTAGTLTVSEVTGLTVAPGGIRSSGTLSLEVLNGNLTGTGNVISTAGNVAINVANGSVLLTSNAGQVSAANLLTVNAAGSSQLNTSVANLAATIGNGSLSINESNGIDIAATGLNTAAGGGSINLNVAAGSIGGAGVLNAGQGNVTISTPNGNVALNSATPPQIIANVLTLRSKGSIAVDTDVTSLNAIISSTGSLTVTEQNNLDCSLAQTANGAVNISTTASSNLSVFNITAATGTAGNVTLSAGNVLVYAPGIKASGTLSLAGVTNTTVVNGTISANVVNNPTPVNWEVTNTTLPTVLNNINNFKGNSAINVTANTVVTLNAPLPAIKVPLNLAGNGNLTIIGTSAGSTASGLTLSGANIPVGQSIAVSGVTLRNFGGAGIDLLNGTRNATISNVAVLNSAIGLRASGNVAGTTVVNSTFDAQNRAGSNGALLVGAQGLKLGLNTTAFNTFSNATIGMTASGNLNGTQVYGNLFNRLSKYGISLAAATNLTVGATNLSLATRNTVSNVTGTGTAGVFATGFCTGSSVNKMDFQNVTTRYSVSQSRNLVIRS